MATWVRRKCAYCGSPFTTVKGNKRKYCCGSCREKGKRKTTAETLADMSILDKVCPTCNKMFRAKGRGLVYCSRSCYVQAMKETPQQRQTFDRCVICGNVLEGNQTRYCSDECAALTSEKTYGERIQKHYLDVTAGADETANGYRCECKLKGHCVYGRSLSGGMGENAGSMYCAYMEITGEIRGGYPDECTHFKDRRRKNGQ